MGFAEAHIKVLSRGLERFVVDEHENAEEETLLDEEAEDLDETNQSEVWVERVNSIDVNPNGVAENVLSTEDNSMVLGILISVPRVVCPTLCATVARKSEDDGESQIDSLLAEERSFSTRVADSLSVH